MTEKAVVALADRELAKLEHICRQRARYQEKREGTLHQAEATFLHNLADKLSRARLRV